MEDARINKKNYFLPKLRNISDAITFLVGSVFMLLNHFLSGNIELEVELEPEPK